MTLDDDAPVAPAPRRRRRGLLLAGALTVVLAVVATALVLLRPLPWASGASGTQAADGSFADWRGEDARVAGTWADDNVSQVEVWPLLPKGEYARWEGDLDLAIGAIGDGESWAQAAEGAYDDRWSRSLRRTRELWRARDRGTLYLRFAHEFNGSWYPWKVRDGEQEAFAASWRRFRALQQDLLPEARLVFSVNRESVGGGYDWREAFPGREHVDVFGVDYYNQNPHAATTAQWREAVRETDAWGGPKGLLRHQEFARSAGLPMAVSEWGNNAAFGESPLFVREMRRFFEESAGDGPGELLYEVYFNPTGAEEGKWALWPQTRQPRTAEAYRRAFSS